MSKDVQSSISKYGGPWLIVGALLSAISAAPTATAQIFDSVPVYTDSWPPYVNEPGQAQGAATRIVEMAMWHMDLQPEFRRVDWSLTYSLIRDGKIRIAYPFSKTQSRTEEDKEQVLFSDEPLLEVTNVFYYYSRNDNVSKETDVEEEGINIGKVQGYSYGDELDQYLDDAILFRSEVLALESLFSNKPDSIDVLPMAEKVGQQLVLKHFPQYYPDFQTLEKDGYRSKNAVYVVTINDAEGKNFIEDFDAALKALKQPDNAEVRGELVDEVLLTHLDRNQGTGYVRLVTGEGHPAIVGEICRIGEAPNAEPANCNCSEDNLANIDKLDLNCPPNYKSIKTNYIAIPQGTRALVLDWSPRVADEQSERIVFGIMAELSQVRIVSGPHFGRELYVKNLHIEVE